MGGVSNELFPPLNCGSNHNIRSARLNFFLLLLSFLFFYVLFLFSSIASHCMYWWSSGICTQTHLNHFLFDWLAYERIPIDRKRRQTKMSKANTKSKLQRRSKRSKSFDCKQRAAKKTVKEKLKRQQHTVTQQAAAQQQGDRLHTEK